MIVAGTRMGNTEANGTAQEEEPAGRGERLDVRGTEREE